MGLTDLLRARRSAVLDRWRKKVLQVYDAAFARRAPDRFANPVEAYVRSGTEGVLDALLEGRGPEELRGSLDGIVRVRSVQDLDPARALGFVFGLKSVVRKVIREEGAEDRLAAELAEFDGRVDALALQAFSAYVGCREEIWELKYRMMRDRSYKLMERAGFLWEEEAAGSPCDRGEQP